MWISTAAAPGGSRVERWCITCTWLSPQCGRRPSQGDYCDLDLAVLDQCDADAGCITLVDATVSTDVPVSGDIYFVVDGYSEEGCPFTLTLTSLPMPPPVTFCAVTEAVSDTFSATPAPVRT